MITVLSSSSQAISWLSGYDLPFRELVSAWIIIMITVSLVCFTVSELTRNYSQVDKLWSLLPAIYSWTAVASFPSARSITMAALVTLWGLRLSYNFYRKGGYSLIPWRGDEDYRWKILRETPALATRFRFGVFNLLFISLYQNMIILLFTTPILMASLYTEVPVGWTDIVAATLMISFLIVETVADNQQFRFQTMKKKAIHEDAKYSGSLEKGFLAEGLWQYVRHPNFASEQGIWVSFYLFSVSASGKLINFTLTGPVLLIVLFIGSSIMTENISSSKYPEYRAYQNEVPKFIPRIFRIGKKN
jgi:steroid 5-alpha reductase family enzyme